MRAVISDLLELTIFLSRSADEEEGAAQTGIRLAGLFTILEEKFQEDWPLKRMAAYAGMSLSTLLRTFQAVVRKSPQEYLSDLRLNAASHLLVNTDRPISEIAFDCGFHDSNYFTKRFQKFYKISPSKYRKKRMSGKIV